jgi:hypothetical protein
MSTTWPLATSPATPTLIDRAHAHGIRIWWRDLPGARAHYSDRHRSIWLSPSLTPRETRCLLAHELGHAAHGDTGPQPPHVEERAWRTASRILVVPGEYAASERLRGPDIAAIADDLDLTVEVVYAHRQILWSHQ